VASKKILLVIGTRPEAIKMAPLYLGLLNDKRFEVKICSTGQHKELLYQILEFYKIKLDYDLEVMTFNQSLSDVTASILTKIKLVLSEFSPDIVMVHGDTTTTFAVSLTAFYEKIKLVHVEAGLRTGNIYSPFPEEFNRQIVSKIALHNFAPTELSCNNLLKDGVSKDLITITGNTIVDSLKLAESIIINDVVLSNKIFGQLCETLKFNPINEKFILVTCHRRENFGGAILNICNAIRSLAEKYNDVHFVLPIHPNPNIKLIVEKNLSLIDNVHLISPQNYENFLVMMKYSLFIVTDSGGIQEEAPTFSKPVLVMRESTERLEAIMIGGAKLIGTSFDEIVKNIGALIEDRNIRCAMSLKGNPFGDGFACKKIIDKLVQL
jgi:UDP-N-acetylglucosamine 2-epimerase (non-hydrolysing)